MTTSTIHLRPLQELRPTVPPSLDGSQGANRADGDGLVQAANDYEVMEAFLGEYSESPGTLRIYTRECERLALWAFHECKKPISSLTRQDFEGYSHFLMDPQPAEIWCGPKTKKEKPEWRPFVGPLEESAVLTAIAALNSFMKYCVDSGYLTGNPLGLIRQRRRKMKAIGDVEGKTKEAARGTTQDDEDSKIERFLDPDMWQAVTKAVEQLRERNPNDTEEYERARFVCAYLYLMAPRVHEMEGSTMNSFREERGSWWWHVVGKGAKRGKVPVPDDMLEALARYRQSLGLSAMPSKNDESPLLRSTRYPGQPITSRHLNRILKRIFLQASHLLPPKLAYKAEKLQSASAHWGRHTGITAKIDSGMGERFVQKDARHADFRTTERYIHKLDSERHAEAQKVQLPWTTSVTDSE